MSLNFLKNKSFQNYTKLATAGIILIWLFIQSPLNPLYSDLNEVDLNFVKISFAYWMIVSIFALWIIFFINRSNFEKFALTIFILSYGLYITFYIPFGFDSTDTGFHLSKQWSMFHGLWKENFDAIAGTNFIGGLWLLIPGKPLLLWSRLGFVLVQVTIALFSYKILALYFKPLRVFFALYIISISLSFWQYYPTINYDNLPLMFLMISVYCLLSGINLSVKKGKIFLLISGIMTIISVFCKLTYLPVILILLIFLRVDKKYKKENLRIFFIGLVIGIFSLALFLIFSNGLSFYLEYIYLNIQDLITKKDIAEKLDLTRDHSIYTLFSIYKTSFLTIFNLSIRIIFMLGLFTYLLSRLNNHKWLKILFIGLFGWLLYFELFEPSANNGILALSGSLLIIWLIISRKDEIKKYVFLILLIPSIFIISFLGSDLGISTGMRSGAAISLMSLCLLLIYDLKIQIGKTLLSFKYFFYLSLVLFGIMHLNDKYKHYQDYKFEFMTTCFKSEQLMGIKSNKDRVEVVDSLLSFMNEIPGLKRKKVFFSKHSPMFYYLTSANYSLNSSWDTLNKLEDIETDLNREAPDIFVIPSGSQRDFRWPNSDLSWKDEPGEVKARRYYDYYDLFIKEKNYYEVYKNSFYTVYGLKQEFK